MFQSLPVRLQHSSPAVGWVWVVGLALVLAFGFLGTRNIWDPDEGRYTNVALNMLDSGDWLTPRRNDEVAHWTKPPGTYWLIAGSAALLGASTWSVRLPSALAFLCCVALAWLTARRLTPGNETAAATVYATMLLPLGAAQLVTADFPLAAAQGMAVYAFVEYRFGNETHSAGWWLLVWAALALGFMVKGPPALLPMLAMLALARLAPAPRRAIAPHWHALGAVLFVSLVAPWFLYVGLRHPGLLEYFVGAEVIDRSLSNRFDRHGEWYGWAQIYVPTLLLGSLPWTRELGRMLRAAPLAVRRWARADQRLLEAGPLFLTLWIGLPLLVFVLARSRLPLYLLPLFLPLAIAIAGSRTARGAGMPRVRWLALWAADVLLLRLAAAAYPTHKDAAEWAAAIRQRSATPVKEVVFVDDMARYGLRLHLGAEVEKISLSGGPREPFAPAYDETLGEELNELGGEQGVVFVAKARDFSPIEAAIRAHGLGVTPLGPTYRDRVIFTVGAGDAAVSGGGGMAGSEARKAALSPASHTSAS